MASKDCPCGTARAYDECCGAVIDDVRPASTAEELMRSRFTAFVLGRADYLTISWDPETRPNEIRIDPNRLWTNLTIIDLEDGQALAASGIVEFRADYVDRGRPGSLHERSNFRRHHGRWVYVDGMVPI